MESFALAVPVQPGKTQALREYVAQLSGPKYNEEQAFHQGVGTRREAAWLQQTPEGDVFVLYWEGEGAERFQAELEQLLKAEDGHGAWVREQFIDLFGVDPRAGLPPLPEKLWDYSDSEAKGINR